MSALAHKKKTEWVLWVIARLQQAYPQATCSLNYQNPLQLAIATILSAQCTDERVNQVTISLFQRYRNAQDFACADLHELEEAVRPTGFFRNKAKSIQQACQQILERHQGNVPTTIEELVQLSGVGRKTANVILGNAFGRPAGVVVDTHVRRLSQRLGLTENNQPEAIERDLNMLIPQAYWVMWPHWLIAHGRAVCQSRKPRCSECVLAERCPAAQS